MTRDRPGFRAAFLRGALRPSLGSLLATSAVALLLLSAAAAIVTPRFVAARFGDSLLQGNAGARLTSHALRLRYSSPDTEKVILLGRSDLELAIADPKLIADPLSKERGHPVEVVTIASGGLLVWELAAVADCIPAGGRGVLVLGVNPTTLARDVSELEERLEQVYHGIDSEAFRDEVRRAGLRAPLRTGIYFLDHIDFFLANRARLAGVGSGPRDIFDRVREEKRPDVEAVGRRVDKLVEVLKGYERNREANLAVLGRVIRLARSRGSYEVAFVEPPRNPDWAPKLYDEAFLADYRERIGGFAVQHDVAYWDLATEARLAPEDFFDNCHLESEAARERYTDALTGRLIEMRSAAGRRKE